jgi:Gpi18-like mannosyltransferase
MPKLSIIVPVFNEKATVREVLERIRAAGLPVGWEREVIVVNDGSTDGTAEVVREFCSRPQAGCPIRCLTQPANSGKGACLRLGIRAASGDAILVQDADLEYDPGDYCRLVEALVSRQADAVYGSRFLSGKRVTTAGHRFVNWVLTAFANCFTGLRLTDVHTCLKLFRASLVKEVELEEDRFGFCPEITAKLALRPGLRLVEVPVSYRPRTRLGGKKVGFRDGLRALYCIVKYSRSSKQFRHEDATPRQLLAAGAWLGLLVAASLLLRLGLFNFESIDYRDYLSPWYDFFVAHGRWHGLSLVTVDVANQSPLYLTLLSLSTLLPLPKLYAIKVVSIGCDFLAGWYVWRLARKIRPNRPQMAWAALAAFLFLPTVVVNSALWGQCDVMYTTGFLASLLYLIEGRSAAAMVAFGVSCSLKPQAIFWCPLLAGLLGGGRLPWKWVWVPPAVYAACGLPSMLAGRPVLPVLAHWALVSNKPGLTLHAPNWYQWVEADDTAMLRAVGIGLALLAGTIFVRWMRKGPHEGRGAADWLVLAAMLSVLFPPFLLPGMHERYFFAADVLCVIYAVSARRGWLAVLLMQFASLSAYCPFLFGRPFVPEILLPVAVAFVIEWVLLDLAGSARLLPRLRSAT